MPFENLSEGAGSFFWSFGDGSPLDTTASPEHVFPVDSTYTVLLTANSVDGVCTDQASQEVVVVFPDTGALAVFESNVFSGVLEGGPVPFGQAGPLRLRSRVDVVNWLLRDASARIVGSGGPVAAGSEWQIDAHGLVPGWHVLVCTGSDGRHWSMTLLLD